MVIYADTSFLVALYVDEEHTDWANRYTEKLGERLAFTPFHRLEFRSALRGRVFRKNLTRIELQEALKLSEQDLLRGILQHIPLVWADALREAERLGAAHLAETGARPGDLLHVASAVVLGAGEFLTFDARQAKLARLTGLKVGSRGGTR
jgi:predicted nucleic acid-binding protein